MIQESQENTDLINSLIIAGIGLLGVILGVIISNLVTWKLKSKESRLRILEKLFDKRLKAHEEFLEIPKMMRTTISNQEIDEAEYFVTYPFILDTKETFEDFSFKFYNATNFSSHWFEEELRKEIFFAQDYFQNLKKQLSEIPEKNCHEFAKIVKPDIKEIADILEEKTLDFLLIDIHKMNLKSKNRNFEYSDRTKKERLHKMKLMTDWDKIKALQNNYAQQ